MHNQNSQESLLFWKREIEEREGGGGGERVIIT
jgi:hypothetical protein